MPERSHAESAMHFLNRARAAAVQSQAADELRAQVGMGFAILALVDELAETRKALQRSG